MWVSLLQKNAVTITAIMPRALMALIMVERVPVPLAEMVVQTPMGSHKIYIH